MLTRSTIQIYLGRFALIAVSTLEAISLPYILPETSYVNIELYRTIATLAIFSHFGILNGFVFDYLKLGNKDIFSEYFTSFLLFSFILFVILFWYNKYYAFIVFSVLIAVYFENLSKVKEKYILAFANKAIVSTYFLAGIFLLRNFRYTTDIIYVSSYVALAITLLLINFNNVELKVPDIRVLFTPLKIGLPLMAGTAGYALIVYLERLHGMNTDINVMAPYSMSMTLLAIGIVVLSTYNYVQSVELSRNHNQNLQKLLKNLIMSTTIGLSFGLILHLGFHLRVPYLYKYEGIDSLMGIVAPGRLVFFISGSISPVLFYRKKLLYPTLLLFLVAVVNLIVSHFNVINFNDLLSLNSVLLSIVGCVNIGFGLYYVAKEAA